jgi:hypothetical protein
MSVVRVFTCDVCGKAETLPDVTFASDFPTPDGWGIESDADHRPRNACSRPCALVVAQERLGADLDRRYPAPAA